MTGPEWIEAVRLAMEICLKVRAGDLTLEQGRKLLGNMHCGFEGLIS